MNQHDEMVLLACKMLLDGTGAGVTQRTIEAKYNLKTDAYIVIRHDQRYKNAMKQRLINRHKGFANFYIGVIREANRSKT